MKSIFKLIFFFIPHHHIGGAERVHLNIIKALKYKPIVFFDYSSTNQISKEFKKNAYCFLLTSSKKRRLAILTIKSLSYVFNVVLFGCNSRFFYTTVAKIKDRAHSIDLTHAFSYPEKGMEIISLEYINWIQTRIVINKKTFDDYTKLYEANNINKNLIKRFKIIENGIAINNFDYHMINDRFNNFTIGFVGRNSPEKRPGLFFEIVKKTKLQAKVIGDNFDDYKEKVSNVNYFEECNEPKVIREQFSEISVLIVTSSREGFPLVIMEAMELGIPVISTNVGSVSDHIINSMNGFLASDNDEIKFLDFAVEKINDLAGNNEVYRHMATNAREYALKHFNIKIFEKKYRELFYE